LRKQLVHPSPLTFILSPTGGEDCIIGIDKPLWETTPSSPPGERIKMREAVSEFSYFRTQR
jgi:hypothetical protein